MEIVAIAGRRAASRAFPGGAWEREYRAWHHHNIPWAGFQSLDSARLRIPDELVQLQLQARLKAGLQQPLC